MIVDPISIKGLREFQAALKATDAGLPKQLRVVFNDAAEVVATDARRRVTARTGRAKGTIKVASQQRRAIVNAGGRKAPYYPWLDYGGRVGRDRSVARPWRPDGRYLFPTYRNSRQAILRTVDGALAKLYDDSGLD